MRMVMAVLLLPLVACVDAVEVAAVGEPPPPVLPNAPGPPGQALELPTGFTAALEGEGLVDPRAVAFDADGMAVVAEGSAARLSRALPDGRVVPLAQGGGNGPWTGVARLGESFYVAEAGGPLGGRILRVARDGAVTPLNLDLPGGGVLGPLAAGPDNWLYLGVATAQAAEGGGRARDIPCQNIRLRQGGSIKGAVPCTGAVLRISPDDADTSVYAWGFTDPVGLAFAPDGRLLVADDVRVPPQVQQAAIGDPLWEAVPGVWYGWPDFAGQIASADPELAVVPNPPPPPLANVAGELSGVAASDRPRFGGANQAFVGIDAADGGQVAMVARDSGEVVPFAANLSRPGPIAFAPDGNSLWVIDAGSGRLWRIVAYPD